jgi:hypothetical protein
MIKLALLACIAGVALGLAFTGMPRPAEAGLVTNASTPAGRDCAFNNLSCGPGVGSCVICGSGSDITCKEQSTCGFITP